MLLIRDSAPSPIYLFLLLLTLVSQCAEGSLPIHDGVSPLLKTNTNSKNPGMYIRLMPTGLAYLREVGLKIVNREILKIQLPTIRESIDAGVVSVQNAYVSKYWAPAEYNLELSPPNVFTWTMSRMHIRAVGEFEAALNSPLLIPSVPIHGQFETLLGHVSMVISIKVEKSPYGSPIVRTEYCKTTVGYVDLNVRDTGVITDFFINAFKAFIIANFKPMVEDRVCQMINRIVNRDINGFLAAMPLQIRLSDYSVNILEQTFGLAPRRPLNRRRDVSVRNATLLEFLTTLRQRSLVMDFRLIRDPQINYGVIDMFSKGEISWNGIGRTPFDPPNVKIPPPNGFYMAEFYGTDYLANSMLYHSYKQKYLDLIIGPESSPQLKDLLITSCSTGFCIGEFLGALSKEYPDREVEVQYFASKSPVMVFVQNRARFRIHGKMNMFLRPQNESENKTLIIRAESVLTSNMYLWINNLRIVGNATVEKLDFKLLETRISDVDQNSFADLGLFGAEFLEKLLTDILQVGFQIPTLKGVVMRSPKMTMHERFLRIQTYFKLDERFAGRVFEGAVRQTLNNIGYRYS
uniref:BPI2 domain-containing protein n=1 Tax=Syphacia muris TaxID=451379 RepID=A0A0N5AUQ0_9BILA